MIHPVAKDQEARVEKVRSHEGTQTGMHARTYVPGNANEVFSRGTATILRSCRVSAGSRAARRSSSPVCCRLEVSTTWSLPDSSRCIVERRSTWWRGSNTSVEENKSISLAANVQTIGEPYAIDVSGVSHGAWSGTTRRGTKFVGWIYSREMFCKDTSLSV